jgi:hypothetical protein
MMVSNEINVRDCVLIYGFEFDIRMYLPHFISVNLPTTAAVIDAKSHTQSTSSYFPTEGVL